MRKLGIKSGHRLALLHAPDDLDAALGTLPEGVSVARSLRGTKPFDVLVCFTLGERDLARRFPMLAHRIVSNGGLWIAWPKKSSGVTTDLTGDVVRAIGLDGGLVDNKVCAIDDTWSALRFVIRVENR